MFAVITCFYHRQKCVCAHAAQALPFPFGRKRKQKGPKRPSRRSLVHGTSAATRLSHERTRSAKLPKLNASRRFKHMGSFVFALSPCKAAHVERSKIPSRATQSDSAGAALAYRKLFKAQSIFNANLFCETNLCTQDVVTQPMVKISKQFSR